MTRIRHFMLLSLLILWAIPAVAVMRAEADSLHHEVRLGWGDMLFETAMWHSTQHTSDYRYTGHLFAEYQYRVKNWLSVGMLADYERVMWRDEALSDQNFYNLSLLPTMRFTYFFSQYVNLYSAVMLGLNINGGTETDMYGRQTACAPAFGITALGMSVGNEHWFGAAEIGGLNALASKDLIYMLGSRLFTASIGYRF